MFSAWFAFALLDFGLIIGSGISAVDSYFSADARSDFDAGTELDVADFVSMFVSDFVTDVVKDFSSSAFSPDLDDHTISAAVVGMVDIP